MTASSNIPSSMQCRGNLRSRGFAAVLCCAMLLGVVTVATPLSAQEIPAQNGFVDERSQQEPNTRISRRQASELAQEAYPGRVLSVRLERGQWRVRMDQDGTVFNVFVHAQSGKVTRPE